MGFYRGMLYQNDFKHLPQVDKEGCLFMSLIDVVAEAVSHPFDFREIEHIYWEANKEGSLGTENSRTENGVFVWNHMGVLNIASAVARRPDVTWEYCAKVYQSQELDKGLTSWIAVPNYWEVATAMIFQVQTAIGGHFRRFDYDPWKTGTDERYLKSIRYYRMKIA